MSKLLTTLDAEITHAADEGVRAELLAKKAAYLARVGSFDEAKSIIGQLRQRFGDGRSPRVSIWVMLAEGLLLTFREMSDEGADRIMRAQALANATRDRALISATSAWRAYSQSERSEFKGMARSLDNAFANADSGDHEVLARLYMILGNARMSVGDGLAAHDLYMFSRHHALECGDQAAIDALIYNKAAFALAWQRARTCFSESNLEQLRKLRIEIASAKTYQQMAGVSALSNFVYLWEARLLLLMEEFDAAVAALRNVRGMQPFARYNYHVSLVDLEIGYCLVRKGERDSAFSEVESAFEADLSGLHDDDRLFAAWLKSMLAEALPRLANPSVEAGHLVRAQDEFSTNCSDLRQILDGLAAHPHIVRPAVIHLRAAP